MLALADAVVVNQGARGTKIFRFHRVARRIATRFGPQTAASWVGALTRFQSTIDPKALRIALASRDIAQVEAVVRGSGFGQMMRSLEDPLRRTAQAAGTASAQVLEEAGFPMQFNAVHPNVVLFARDQAAQLVVDVGDDVKEAIRTVVALGQQQGLTIVQQARAIRETVGLPPNWAKAPLNLSAQIRAGDIAGATRRRLSAIDKSQIRSRIQRGTVDEVFISRMQERYSQSLVNRRALNIARTENLRAANAGQQESWIQARQQGVLPKNSRRFWIVTPDEALSVEHAQIPAMNPDGRGMDETFATPDGDFMFPPSRTNCRCGIGLGVPTAGAGEAPQFDVSPTLKGATTSGRAARQGITGIDVIPGVWNKLPAAEQNLLSKTVISWEGKGTTIRSGDSIVNAFYEGRTNSIHAPRGATRGVIAHETGHAVDAQLGRLVGFENQFSESAAFRKAVSNGLRTRGDYSSFMKSSYAAEARSGEVFADIYSALRVRGDLRMGLVTKRELKEQFSEAVAIVERRLARLTGAAPAAEPAVVADPFVGYLKDRPGVFERGPVGRRLRGANRNVRYTQDEVDTLLAYQNGEYDNINGALRAGARAVGRGAKADLANLDGAVARSAPIGERTVMWRGSRFREGQLPRVGDVMTDNGFVSVTADLDTATGFVSLKKDRIPAMMRIGTKRNTRGVWMDTAIGDGDEAEWLLARGTRFRVRRVRQFTFDEYMNEFRISEATSDILSDALLGGSRKIAVVDLEII